MRELLHASTEGHPLDYHGLVRPVVMAATLVGVALPPTIAVAQTLAAERKFIDIPALPANQALQRFVEATAYQLAFSPEVIQGLISKPVSGAMTPREALERMLAGSGVQIVDTGPGAATLRASRGITPDATAAASLQDVLVTARKTSERMMEVPIAITVLTGESLRERGASNVNDVLQDAPGVAAIPTEFGGTQISIRGISSTLGGNENGYYLDELPFTGVTVPISPDVRAWDLSRIEILRGPQGTLFGEGSMGGTIRILTNNAKLGELGFAAQAGVESIAGGSSSYAEKLMLNLPIGDKIAVRIAATHEELGGWVDDSQSGLSNVNNSRIDTQRIKVRFDPIDRLTINGSYWSYDAKFGTGNNATDSGTVPLSNGLSSGQKYNVKGLTAAYDFDDFSVFYGFSKSHFLVPQEGALAGGNLFATVNIDVKSNELRFASNGIGHLKWTAGLYQRVSKRSDAFTLAVFGIDNVSNTNSTTSSVFAEASYTLPSMPIELTAGVRQFHDHLTGQDFNSGAPTALQDFNFNSTNPRFSVAWKPDRNLQIYTSVAKGFRSGQIQPSANIALAAATGQDFPASLRPDSIWTYELGAKTSVIDQRMIIEAAIFHSDWKDLVVREPIGTTGFNGLQNSDGVTSDGIEANMAIDVSKSLSMSVGGSYIRAVYAGDVPGTGITKGSRVDNVPSTTISASGLYRFPTFTAWQGILRVGYQHTSARSAPSFPQNTSGDAINNLNGRISFEKAGWTFSLYGENLTNDHGAVSARTVQSLSATETESYANRLRPRTIGLEMKYALGR